MPSLKLDLGKYVVLRKRKDGTTRVLMEVPARLRPSGWLPAIPLPVQGVRKGDLTDLDEVRRIQEDARKLYVNLINQRAGIEREDVNARDFAHLNREWQSSQGFKAKKPRTQQGYAYHAGLIADWAVAAGNKPVAGLDREAIERFLSLYDDRPTTRRHLKIVLKMMLDHAVAMRWRQDNPAERIKVLAPATTVTIWEPDDVSAQTWACVLAGQTAVAALILTQWEIGQRLTDARLFRRGAEYQPQDGAFRFYQSKTRSYVTIPVSDRLRALLDMVCDPASLYLFTDPATGKPFAEQRLGHVFAAVRVGKKKLTLRALRHSCVVQLARSGATVPDIASVTGHSPFSAEQILSRYLPRDSEIAWNAQRKRGLISTIEGQKSDGSSDGKSDESSPPALKVVN